ncbi:MAG: hypothetical protein PHV85_04270 [Desulfovibrionaceae bacterium]|nr:hypothetical protein [Desulfovibrionaceae bacterium]
MALIFGSPKNNKAREESGQDQRLGLAKDVYLAGKIKIATLEGLPGRTVQGVFGLIFSRSYSPDNAFYGLISQALDVNADAILGYRENVAFHPEGDKYYTCYGTAVRLKPLR